MPRRWRGYTREWTFAAFIRARAAPGQSVHTRPPALAWALGLWAALPLAALAYQISLGQGLGPNPQEEIIRGLGQVMLALLLWVYAMPLWARWADPRILSLRRSMGLWTFAYGVMHFLAYVQFDQDGLWSAVLGDSLQRPFVSVGIIALALLLALALTSNQWSMRTLGTGWKRLHRLVHLVVMLALLHFFLHKMGKNDYREVWLYGGAFLGVALLKAWPAMARRLREGRAG